MNHLNVLMKPLTKEQMKVMVDEDYYIKGIVPVALGDMIDYSFDDFLDILSEKLTDSPCLMDIQYKVVGVVNENVVAMEVSGDVSEILDFDDEE